MRDIFQTIRFNGQLDTRSGEASIDLWHLAEGAVAFLTAIAVVIDAFGLLSLVWQLVARGESFKFISSNVQYLEMASTPLYLLASLIGMCVTATSRDTNSRLSLGWLAGLVVATISLSQSWHSAPTASIPCWGLLAFWSSLMCTTTLRKSESPSLASIAFFVSVLGCLVLWGKHGNLEVIQSLFPNWQGLDAGNLTSSPALSNADWKTALAALTGGFLAVVVLPCILVHVLFGVSAKSFGLSVPTEKRGELLFRSCLLLFAGFPIFYLASSNPEIQNHYPYVRNFSGPLQLVIFEISTLLFYTCVEFVFRGYVLFGVERILQGEQSSRKLTGSALAILASAVPYIVWHLEKPTPELLGALVWAIVAGISAVQYRTVLHLIIIHWLWNVCLDLNVLRNLEIGFTG